MNNQPITLTSELGKGGEATIYHIAEHKELVAKIYHNPTPQRKAKLLAMLLNPPEQPKTHIAIAWPTALLYQQKAQFYAWPARNELEATTPEKFVGFLMPKISGGHAIFHLYNPVMRAKLPYLFDWRALHYTAYNLCVVVEAIHAKGYVIGDINESNILVNRKALVTIVDCDSFQVKDETGTVYRCMVGKPEYTPPELQGADLKVTDQTVEHDLFGLAVLLFQLLMEGYHPFAGILQNDLLVERVDLYALKAGLFPYQTRSNTQPIIPPPHAPDFTYLFLELQTHFKRSFSQGYTNAAYRSTATEWQTALQRANQTLKQCDQYNNHIYAPHLATCPHCTQQSILAKQTEELFQPDLQKRYQAVLPLNEAKQKLTTTNNELFTIPIAWITVIITGSVCTSPILMSNVSYLWFILLGVWIATGVAGFIYWWNEKEQAKQGVIWAEAVEQYSLSTKATIDKIEGWWVWYQFKNGYQVKQILNSVVVGLLQPGMDISIRYQETTKQYLFRIDTAQSNINDLLQHALATGKQAYKQGNYQRTQAIMNNILLFKANTAYQDRLSEAQKQYYHHYLGEAQTYLAKAYHQQGATYEANRAYRLAVQQNPNHALLHCYKAQFHFEQGEDDFAMWAYDQSIQLNSDNPMAYYGRGQLYHRQKNYEAAITDYSRAITFNHPEPETVYFKRAKIYAQRHEKRLAVADFDKAIANNYIPISELYYERGLLYRACGEIENAQRDWQQALVTETDTLRQNQIKSYLKDYTVSVTGD